MASTPSNASRSALPPVRLESRHQIPFSREAIWPFLSNTDLLNRSVGLPPVSYDIGAKPEGGGEIRARARFLGQELRWRELPFEWIEPQFYRVRRIFETGPFRDGRMGMDLIDAGDYTEIVAYSELIPRSRVGRWLALKLLGPKARRDLGEVVARLTEFLRGRQTVALPRLPTHPPDETALRIGLQKLRETGQPENLVQQLENFLRESPDVELSHIRPLAVARKWGRDQWGVLRLFLHTPRCGLLDLRWEILCPNCRGAGQRGATTLGNLKRTSHCDACQIEFDGEFDKSVELKFSVNPALRPLEDQTYCLAGPGGKPHVVSQMSLDPLEERTWTLPSSKAPLRLRSPQVKKPWNFSTEGEGGTLTVECAPDQFVVQREKSDAPLTALRVRNPNSFPLLLDVEQVAWSEDILTAARVTGWQDFRELFANEVISPTEQVTVGSQVVLFTDLRGSTAMYHGLGDPRAYALVRNHFTVLVEAVRANHGTVVKTIGDAVMAAFSRVDEALAAVRKMHLDLAAANTGLAAPLALKSSLHAGPCLVVNANERLDLFGTSINLAARMVDCCRGGDLTVADEFYGRPEVAEFVRALSTPPEKAEIKFRGFDAPQVVWRIQIV